MSHVVGATCISLLPNYHFHMDWIHQKQITQRGRDSLGGTVIQGCTPISIEEGFSSHLSREESEHNSNVRILNPNETKLCI